MYKNSLNLDIPFPDFTQKFSELMRASSVEVLNNINYSEHPLNAIMAMNTVNTLIYKITSSKNQIFTFFMCGKSPDRYSNMLFFLQYWIVYHFYSEIEY